MRHLQPLTCVAYHFHCSHHSSHCWSCSTVPLCSCRPLPSYSAIYSAEITSVSNPDTASARTRPRESIWMAGPRGEKSSGSSFELDGNSRCYLSLMAVGLDEAHDARRDWAVNKGLQNKDTAGDTPTSAVLFRVELGRRKCTLHAIHKWCVCSWGMHSSGQCCRMAPNSGGSTVGF